ncbi:hypothetical protein [Mycobacterium vicinigordonae]|uniref:hypothetical protein n=1 Tax=Mycobacterium vicinigordonae TaxID=1719132 RepID=UPI003CCE17B9
MVYEQSGSMQLTDADVDALACKFLSSPYADQAVYASWSLDRRLEGFLCRRDLSRLAEDGDAFRLILERVMSYIGLGYQTSASGCPVREIDEGLKEQGLPSLAVVKQDRSNGQRHNGDFEI